MHCSQLRNIFCCWESMRTMSISGRCYLWLCSLSGAFHLEGKSHRFFLLEALSGMSSSPVKVRCEQHIQIAWMIRYFGYSFGEPEVNINLSCEWRERKTVLQGRQAKSESQDHYVKSDFIYILVTSSVHLARGAISLCVTAGFELIVLWGMNIKYHLSFVVKSWWDNL